MRFTIKITIDGRPAESITVQDGDELTVGRDRGSDVVVADRSVSRKHCRLIVVKDGLEFQDLGSANGIQYGGKAVESVIVAPGEEVKLGTATLSVSRPAAHTGMIPVQDLLDGFSGDLDSVSEMGIDPMDLTPIPLGEGVVEGARDGGGITRATPDKKGGSKSQLSSEKPEYKRLARERLALLVETSKSLGQSIDMETLLSKIMDHLFEILQVQRGVVALAEDDGSFSVHLVRPQTDEAEHLSQIASQGVLKQVVESRQACIVEDASLDEALALNRSVVMSNIRAAICAPLIANDVCLGAIYADFPGRASLYNEGDLEFLTAFANIAAVSLSNARMTAQIRENDRLKRDLEIAAELQQGLLPDPDEAFDFPGLEVDWAYWPSLRIGGDFYDVMGLEGGRVALLIGDVSGKSVPAALYMARTLSFLRASLANSQDPGKVMTLTNQLLGERGEAVIFATTFLAVIDPGTGVLQWANAGHNPALIRNSTTGEVTRLEATHLPLGIDADVEYTTQTLQIQPGALITLYTDGLTEARDTIGAELGEDAVNRMAAAVEVDSVRDVTRSMIDTVRRYIAGAPYLRDDIAILNVRLVDE